jgi:Reverse transcriptase (RNA-dependent DNA polymerase)
LQVSPMEQFTGRKLDMKRDLSFGFGDYVQATVPNTNNTLQARTEGCIALLSKGNLTGSVYMYNIGTGSVCTRDQFKILPIPDVVITLLTDKATKQGFRRGAMDQGSVSANIHQADQLPNGMGIDQEIVDMRSQQADSIVDIAGVTDNTIRETVRESCNDFADEPTPGLDDDEEADAEDVLDIPTDVATAVPSPAVPSPVSPNVIDAAAIGGDGHRYGTRLAAGIIPYRGAPPSKLTLLAHDQNEDARREIRRQLELRQHWRDTTYAFTISVKMAMRDRGEEARPVIMAEIQQMVDKRVWHGVHLKNLSHEQRKRIIRSKMFLKDKYLASGAFDRFKARLVAGGDMQDKSLYEELSSPTAATSSVLAVAAIAAKEGRRVVTIDIGGAFLNAKMPDTGIKVHMRLDSMMTELLLKIDPSYAVYLEPRGTVVVELDKALYGCVEAAALWYDDLKKTIQRDGFEENPYDRCIFNKICKDGSQMTIALHVDDLMITNLHDENLDSFFEHLKQTYKETKIVRGQILDYVGMTFNFSVAGEVKITMENCVNEILADCGVTQVASTPASPMLFNIRDGEKASGDESKWFHSYTAKMLYLSKRARPECLTTVAFLTTRVNVCDKDDLGKLRRLLAYLRGTKERGIILRIGERMEVRTYIDAAYGVHTSSGKSHTGCVVVIGEGGPVYNKSSKQKIVTKSSTEAELVGLSDSVSQALHMRHFLIAQGYVIGPVIIHQDNMSCMALIKKGGPCSERSRHINIRYFWLCSKVESGEAIVVHLRTEMMFANVLTKPVQGSAFVNERGMLTNWT